MGWGSQMAWFSSKMKKVPRSTHAKWDGGVKWDGGPEWDGGPVSDPHPSWHGCSGVIIFKIGISQTSTHAKWDGGPKWHG